MTSFREHLGKKDTKKKAPASSGGFSSFLKSQAPKTPQRPPSKSPANPNTPGHAEYMKQLDQRMPSTSVKKNFLPSIGGAFKEAGKIALELPKSVVTPFTKPSETTRAVEKQVVPTPKGKAERIISAPVRALSKAFIRASTPIVEELGNQIGTAIGTKGKVLPSPNDAFLAGGTFGLGLAGSVSVGNAKGIPKETVPNRVVQVVGKEKTFYTIPKVQSTEIINKIDNSGGIIPKNEQGNFHVTAKTPAQMKAQGFKNGGTITPEKIPAVYKKIEQPQIKTPEIKVSKLAQGVEDRVIAKKLADGFGDLPEYATVNVKDQAKAASSLIKTNQEQAINIAMGRELPPEGILPESVFVAVEDYALKTKDVGLLRDLATSSTLTSEATGMGQRIRMLAERNPNSSISTMRKVMKIREEAATRKYGDVKKARAKVTDEIITEVRKTAPKAKDWSSFLEEIKCR